MTTLFPQIKRVDEDETSKIIKNVLIDDQDELKLEHIFDEFMHLTEESITFSDDEDEDDDDDEEDEDDDDDEDNGEEEEEDDSDDDDDEEDEEDDDDDSSSGSDESDSSESDEEKKPEPQPEPSHRQPTSWNLDQFIKTIPVTTLPATTITTTITNTTIPVTTLPATTTTTILTTTTTNSTTTTDTKTIAPIISQQHTTTNTTAPTTNNTSHPKATKTPSPIPAAPTLAPTPSPKSASVTVPVPAGTTATITTNNHNHNHNNHNLNNANNSAITPAQQQPSGSLMIEIDLSKLKRIPTTKVPTPNTTSNSMMTAKALKHEADAEKDKTKQAIKYLESAMYFVLHGYELEDSRYYQDTVPLFKHVLRSSMPGSSEHQDNMTNLKIHTLTLKCLSLIHMKMYKLREREVNENYKVIYSPQNKSPVPHADPSLIGIRPTLLSAFKRQLQILSYLRCANDYWQQADHFCDQHPAVRIFFSTIDSNCGNLTMSSPLSHLMDHFKCGLKLLRS